MDRNNPDRDKLRFAADVLRSGGLVAFPTETVYGLGANALDEKAVYGIFNAKGRPSDNPLIVHIADTGDLPRLVREVPETAQRLIDAYWPGPLTLVMKKSDVIPPRITAGLDTVGIRMPSHPVARELIALAKVPVAAPSANISGKPSTTTAAHVIEDLAGKVDVIIDSGSSEVGVESTVLDATVDPPVILRPGGITPEQVSRVAGAVQVDASLFGRNDENFVPRSPGMKYTHYSPEADVYIVDGPMEKVVEFINRKCAENAAKGIKTGVLASEQTMRQYGPATVICAGDRNRPETVAAGLFDNLRRFDHLGVQVIYVEAFDAKGIGLAVMNRLYRAAGGKLINISGGGET